MLKLYKNIKELRLEQGKSQEELAALVGYTSRSSIAKIEAGEVDLPVSKIRAFAKVFGVTEDYLLGNVSDPFFRLDNEAIKKDINSYEDNDTPLPPDAHALKFKKRIPILGRIAAGEPIIAEQYIEGYIPVEDGCLDYALRVKGDSMINANIMDGALVLVQKDADYENGNIVVALINGNDATVKRYYRYGNEVILRPENPGMKELHYKPEEVQLLGKVLSVQFDVI